MRPAAFEGEEALGRSPGTRRRFPCVGLEVVTELAVIDQVGDRAVDGSGIVGPSGCPSLEADSPETGISLPCFGFGWGRGDRPE